MSSSTFEHRTSDPNKAGSGQSSIFFKSDGLYQQQEGNAGEKMNPF